MRGHGKMATCLREADTAKAGNAAGGFFQQGLQRAGHQISQDLIIPNGIGDRRPFG